jgi:uncharacterized protein YjbJ (UPF0337 family)
MAWKLIRADLKELISNVKEQWIWFVDDQIDFIKGKRNHLSGMVQKVYVIDSEEAEKQLADRHDLQKD